MTHTMANLVDRPGLGHGQVTLFVKGFLLEKVAHFVSRCQKVVVANVLLFLIFRNKKKNKKKMVMSPVIIFVN